jgi:hypothetical protein
LPEWLKHAREVIPREAEQVERMLDELLMGKTRLYEEVVGGVRSRVTTLPSHGLGLAMMDRHRKAAQGRTCIAKRSTHDT